MVKLMLRCFGKPLLVRRGFFDDNLLAKANVYWGWGHYGMAFRVGLNQFNWIGNLEPPCDELPIEPERQIIKIVDFIGRETQFRTDIPLIIIYDDGSVEKTMMWGN